MCGVRRCSASGLVKIISHLNWTHALQKDGSKCEHRPPSCIKHQSAISLVKD